MAMGRGYVFTPNDFQDVTGSASIRATLTRLAGEGTIRLVLRGVYEYPRFSEILQAAGRAQPALYVATRYSGGCAPAAFARTA